MSKKKQFDETEVLNSITDYFSLHGYSATRVDKLAQITGLTKTSIYNAFGNKEALFLKSIDHYVEHGLETYRAHLDTRKPMSENLEQILRLDFDHTQDQAEACLITNSILELKNNEPGLHQHVIGKYREVQDIMREFFRDYVRSGRVVPGIDGDDLADLFMTLRQGLIVQGRLSQSREAQERSIRTFLLFIRSIEVPGPDQA